LENGVIGKFALFWDALLSRSRIISDTPPDPQNHPSVTDLNQRYQPHPMGVRRLKLNATCQFYAEHDVG
jgi:hypothetical protein